MDGTPRAKKPAINAVDPTAMGSGATTEGNAREQLIDARGRPQGALMTTVAWTCTLSGGKNDDEPWPTLVLQFGSGGVSHNVVLDALRGGHLSVAASVLRVFCEVQGTWSGSAKWTGGLVGGVRGDGQPNTYTERVAANKWGNAPLFARRLFVLRADGRPSRVRFNTGVDGNGQTVGAAFASSSISVPGIARSATILGTPRASTFVWEIGI